MGRRISKGRLKENGNAEPFSDGLKDNACLKTENSKDILDSEIAFLWDGSHLLQETHSDGLYTYIYADTNSYEPLAQIRDWTDTEGESKQQTHYFHCDQIGIPREMTDKDGNLLWFGDYYGWGKLKSETNITETAHQPFRLQNQYCDEETGLHYNFFRYYEPDAGRFVNQDPIKLSGGNNFYQFASNPTVQIDPFGLAAFILAVPAAIEIGAAIKGALFVGSAAVVGYAGSKVIENSKVDTCSGKCQEKPEKEKNAHLVKRYQGKLSSPRHWVIDH